MSDTVLVRRGEPRDAERVTDFNRAMAEETEGTVLDAEIARRGVDLLLAYPDRGFYVVAEEGGEVRASLMVTTEWSDWRAGTFWWIQSVYVAPEHRRTGLFRALYAWVRERAAADPDVRGLRLYVVRDNETAHQTYEAVGMHETPYRLYEELLDRR